MNSKTIKMSLKKSTKGTHVYEEDISLGEENVPMLIPSVYIRKTGLPSNAPSSIEVTIQWVE